MMFSKGNGLKAEEAPAAHVTLLLDEDLKVLVDDGHSQQNTRARANGACVRAR